MPTVDIVCTSTTVPPEYSSDGAIGLDLYADLANATGDDFVTLYPGDRKLISTGVRMAIPPTHYGRIAPRSGLALKKGVDVLGGVIDADYRGDIGVILVNLGNSRVDIRHGDKIAQIIFERADRMSINITDILDSTARGAGGFGSTGG